MFVHGSVCRPSTIVDLIKAFLIKSDGVETEKVIVLTTARSVGITALNIRLWQESPTCRRGEWSRLESTHRRLGTLRNLVLIEC